MKDHPDADSAELKTEYKKVRDSEDDFAKLKERELEANEDYEQRLEEWESANNESATSDPSGSESEEEAEDDENPDLLNTE